MRILFVHQNFPGQYAHLLRHYAADPRNEIVFVTRHANGRFAGIRKIVYRLAREAGAKTHPYVRSIEQAVLHGQAVARVALRLRNEGFVPDVMLGHNAWGETLYLKDVYPEVPLLSYFEFYYRAKGADVGFDPEFPADLDARLRIRTLNAVNLMGMEAADRGQSPTEWQRSTYPLRCRDRITVAHEGIDTDRIRPDPQARFVLPDGRTLTRADEVITYAARNLEPYRGFHVILRALLAILRARPKAQVLVAGGDEVSYGRRLPQGESYRQKLLAELGGKVDASRVHFLGRVPHIDFIRMLQVSTAHVYLTYPFLLSWSMLEAMAAGCVVIGSATAPVQEVILDGENGLLVDFFDQQGLAERVGVMLGERDRFEPLSVRARQNVVEHYDLKMVCLPRQVAMAEGLLDGLAREAGKRLERGNAVRRSTELSKVATQNRSN